MEYLFGILSLALAPLSFLPMSSVIVFFISSPAMTFSFLVPLTALTIYHLEPRFMYSGFSVMSVKGEVILLLTGVSLWKAGLVEILSLSIGN